MYVRVRLSSEGGRRESYNDKLVCARDWRSNRWESVAKRRECGARSETEHGGKLKEDHIFREFEDIVHLVRLRLKGVGVGSWRG